jgi:hypothetical protein
MLLGKKDWHDKLQELADDHIKPLVDPFGVGEGRHQVLWIWMMEGINCNGYESADDGKYPACYLDISCTNTLLGVRIEWCKSPTIDGRGRIVD